MVEVRKDEQNNTKSLIRSFSERVKKSGILDEYRDSLYYEKEPNDREKKEEALYRIRTKKEKDFLRKLGEI